METDERSEKKQFLVEEIVEKGYSPELFTAYCEEVRSSDIDEWSLQGLKDCVESFKRKYPREENTQETFTSSTLPPISVPGHLPLQHESFLEPEAETIGDLKTDGFLESPVTAGKSDSSEEEAAKPAPETQFTDLNVEPMDGESYSLHCVPLPESPLSQHLGAKSTIISFSVASGGLLSSSHADYELMTTPFNWHVSRRESDFLWLKAVLQTAYPGYYVLAMQLPPNPPKKATNKFEAETLKKRAKYLQEFLDSLMRCEVYRRSPMLVGFLRDSGKQFELLKKVGGM